MRVLRTRERCENLRDGRTKERFSTVSDANVVGAKVLRRNRAQSEVYVYRCASCAGYHLSSGPGPDAVVRLRRNLGEFGAIAADPGALELDRALDALRAKDDIVIESIRSGG